MVTEDYCSFEISKLLKEKGFDWLCRGFYYKDSEVAEPYFRSNEGIDNWNEQPLSVRDLWFSAPTHQMAMKWLREKDIFIDVSFQKEDGVVTWFYIVFSDIFSSRYGRKNTYSKNDFPTYEEAVEAAIKYSLENLI